TGAALGGRIRHHPCGLEETTQGLNLSEEVAWGMGHCNCPSATPAEETVHVLQGYGVRVAFRSWRGAQGSRNGILSAIKDYVARKISAMEHGEAHNYIRGFWGGGSYEGLTVPQQRADGQPSR